MKSWAITRSLGSGLEEYYAGARDRPEGREDAYSTDIVDDLVPGAIVLNFRVGDVGDDTANGLADEVVLLVTEVLEDGGFDYGLVEIPLFIHCSLTWSLTWSQNSIMTLRRKRADI